MNYPFYIFLGTLPSIIWLFFYLQKDRKPEPKSMVIKVFFYGMLAALPAVFIEKGISIELQKLSLSSSLMLFLNTFLGIAPIEEGLKYLVVRGKVLKSKEFDEPIDAMLYMIIAALGFAAFENILILFQITKSLPLSQALFILILRFWGATLLHALCSAVVGFYLALSFLKYQREKLRLITLSLIMAICLHGLYNFFIMKGGIGFFIPIAVLISSAIFVSLGFKRLEKISSKAPFKT